jgi:small subunit ribosomal protein S6
VAQAVQEEDQLSERVYEILFIADPNLGEPEVEALAAQVQGFVEKEGGVVQKREMWGKKRLAYDVGRHREGYYTLIVTAGPGSLVKEVERRLKVTDGIFRFLTVRVDEELRKAERRKAKRTLADEKRKTRPGAQAPRDVEVQQ